MSSATGNNQRQSRPDGFFAGVLEGLVEVSWSSLGGSVLAGLLIIAYFSFQCRENRVAEAPESDFLTDSHDDYGRLTRLALRGAASLTNGGKDLVLVGSSGLNEALADEAALGQLWRNAVGENASTLALTAQQFSLEERIAVSERLNSFRGVVAVSINPRQLHRPASQLAEVIESDRLGFSSRALSEELTHLGIAAPKPTGWNLYDHRRFFSVRPALMTGISTRPQAFEWHHDYGTGRSIRDMRRLVAGDQWTVSSDLTRNLEVLRLLVQRLRQSGANVVLFEMPTADLIDPQVSSRVLEQRRKRYVSAVETLVRETGVPYLNFCSETGMRSEDFADPWHIRNSQCRIRFTETLVNKLAPIARSAQ